MFRAKSETPETMGRPGAAAVGVPRAPVETVAEAAPDTGTMATTETAATTARDDRASRLGLIAGIQRV